MVPLPRYYPVHILRNQFKSMTTKPALSLGQGLDIVDERE